MAEAFVFLTDGFEEVEALTVLDVLRRGGCEVLSVSLTGRECVTGSHRIAVLADTLFDTQFNILLDTQSNHPCAQDCDANTMLILPGGPGTADYGKHDAFLRLLQEHHRRGGRIAAICAAPSVLGGLGLLHGKTAVCYPSFEPQLTGAVIGRRCVESDGMIITSKGPATALLFALEVLCALKGPAVMESVREQMLEPLLKDAYTQVK